MNYKELERAEKKIKRAAEGKRKLLNLVNKAKVGDKVCLVTKSMTEFEWIKDLNVKFEFVEPEQRGNIPSNELVDFYYIIKL